MRSQRQSLFSFWHWNKISESTARPVLKARLGWEKKKVFLNPLVSTNVLSIWPITLVYSYFLFTKDKEKSGYVMKTVLP